MFSKALLFLCVSNVSLKEFQSAKFLAMDVTCQYVPYMDKVSEAPTHFKPLQEMRHCLSVMHAKAHNTKCEVKLLSN